ncbi:MAG TPA: hypothetical protein VF596_15980 [Pyrinomonadaceae bacterium]|jgi:tetratricopeptide (TPR) repeat protein
MTKRYFSLILFAAIVLIAQSQSVLAQKAADSKTLKFDQAAEQEFIKGIQGDSAALERAMKTGEKILASNPKDALALVWQGGARLVLARNAFYQGDFMAGSALWKQGLDDMEKAVEFAPGDTRVLVVRGSTWYQASKEFPDPNEANRLLQTAITDFEKIIAVNDDNFKQLPAEIRDGVLLNLAEGYERIGAKTRARNFYQRLSTETTGKTRETAVKWIQANKQ